MNDIEELIRLLKSRGLSNGSSLGHHSGLYDEAADTLSTLQAENNQLRAELERVKRSFGQICDYIDSEGYLRKQFCENGNSDFGPCICPSLAEHPGYIDSDDCEGCDYFCNSWSQKERGGE